MATHDESTDESMTAAEAGQIGGEKVLERHGTEFYSEIGSQQGAENNPGNLANRDKEDVEETARHGGQARSQDSPDELDEAA